ncbi:MAG TPA: hypothetical protein VHG91_19040 [Longimicrobium sp.]|nr:hypothetical protein [Longimicrobium sp.]
MWIDPIIEDVRREREAHAEQFGFDVAAIARELQRLEQQEGDRVILLPPEAPPRKRSSAA